MPLSPSASLSANLIEGITVKRHALGELVRSLVQAAEHEEALYEELRTALAGEEREEVVRLAGELLSLRPAPEPKLKNCTNTAA